MEKPLVSICCISYNHEAYIREAFESFLAQKTNFKYEIVISDDCSQDKTRAIIEEYKQKYPELFHDVSPKKNLGAFANFKYVQEQACGKYIALCEGDDYWTDPLKLQKQIDFLEDHPDFSMCCHGADVLNETSLPVVCTSEYMTTREYFPTDAFPTWQIPTASIVYRRKEVLQYKVVHYEDFTAADVILILRCMAVGRVWGFAEHMSVYRMNPGGLTSKPSSIEQQLKQCKHYWALMENFPKIEKDYCNRFIAMTYYTCFRTKYKDISQIKALFIALKHSPIYVFKKIFKIKSKPRNDLFYKHYHC